MIELQQNTWAARLYAFAAEMWGEFKMGEPDTQNTNLCTYIRTVFVWFPLVIVVHVAFISWISYVLVIYPIMAFGSGYASFWLWVAGLGALGVALWFLYRQSKRATKLIGTAGDAIANTSVWRESGTFMGLIWRYIGDFHDRICTPIKFRRDAS